MTSLDQAFIRAFSKEDQPIAPEAVSGDKANTELYVEVADSTPDQLASAPIGQSTSIIDEPLEVETPTNRNYTGFIVDTTIRSLDNPTADDHTMSRETAKRPHVNPAGECKSVSLETNPPTLEPEESTPVEPQEPTPSLQQTASVVRMEPTVVTSPPLSFKPVWEVDEFQLPSPCLQMHDGLQEQLYSVRSLIRDVFHDQQKLISIHSCNPGEGRTTLAIGLAYFMAQQGHEVLIIDANHDQPNLAETLGLSVEFGWERFESGEEPLEECCIRSLQNRFSILPMISSDWSIGELGFGQTLRTMVGSLINAFDLILLDTSAGRPVWSSEMEDVTAAHFIIRDVRQTSDDALLQMKRHLKQHSNRIVETIENFSIADHINLKKTA